MSPRVTWAVAARVLRQLRHDHRTLAMLLVLPCLILALLRWMYDASPSMFDLLGPALLAIVPLIVMFLVTSVTMLRERSSGTLERLLAMPVGKLDLLLGYALAFGLLGTLQSGLAVALCVGPLGMTVEGAVGELVVVAVADALLGTSFGLFVSAFARTEFQAVQFMPAAVFPQLLLCGLFVPRDQLPTGLDVVSDLLPLSYAVDAMTQVAQHGGDVWSELAVVVGCTVVLLGLGAATLRRRTA
ncbi:MAG TPA: ABC transporter permease [Marmoricola sp.]|nr:ABC transporter permease [Marmoricola sp.]